MTNEDTDQLITRIKDGDTRAYEILVNGYKSLVFSLTLRMLKNKEEAEEIAQDVFVKVFTSIHNFKGDSKFSTWLYRVTRNRCLDYLRSKRKVFNEINVDDLSYTRLDEASNALELMMEDERNEKLRDCFQYISADDASVLTLFYFEEKNLQEVAEVLDTTVNSAKVRLHRARKRLAAVLIDKMEPEILKNYG